MLAADGPETRVVEAAVAAGVLVTYVVLGTAVAWLRGEDRARRQWTRAAKHVEPGGANSRAMRVIVYFTLTLAALVGAVVAAVDVRPTWFGVLVGYDLMLLSFWWLVVAVNGNRLRRAKR